MLELREFKKGFFDRKGIADKATAAGRKALSQFGAFVRRRAKSSIRKSKKSAPPGQPPKSHEGSLRRLIFFAYDSGRQSVVIGPVKFRRGEAPPLLEHGGTVVRRRRVRTKGKPATGRRKETFLRLARDGRLESKPAVYQSVRAVYRGNPFMEPAAEAELPKFRERLRNAIR